jgi:hypothetical protein
VAPTPAQPAAQPSEPPPPPPRLINVETPPPAAPVERTYHMHEGFYFRASLGIGALNQSVSTDTRSEADFSTSGGGLAYDIMIGGSPATGLAIGGTIMGLGATNANVEVDDVDTGADVNASHGIIGVFIDGFPQPNGGLHLGGALGFAGDAIDPDQGETRNLGGFGGAAWLGYGFWVGPDWSLGGMLQLSGTLTREEKDGVTRQASSLGTSLLFTALYH